MQTTTTLLERSVAVHISALAEKQLQKESQQVCLEMELYFSCLIRKRLIVGEASQSPFQADINDKLRLGFKPVMTKVCAITNDDVPELEACPVVDPERFIPHWVKVDYKKGQWTGDFGYRSGNESN